MKTTSGDDDDDGNGWRRSGKRVSDRYRPPGEKMREFGEEQKRERGGREKTFKKQHSRR